MFIRLIEVCLARLNVIVCGTCDFGRWKFRSDARHYMWQCRPLRLLLPLFGHYNLCSARSPARSFQHSDHSSPAPVIVQWYNPLCQSNILPPYSSSGMLSITQNLAMSCYNIPLLVILFGRHRGIVSRQRE